jgi:hypothetical protein
VGSEVAPSDNAAAEIRISDTPIAPVIGVSVPSFDVRAHCQDSDAHVGLQQPGCGSLEIFLLAMTTLEDRFLLPEMAALQLPLPGRRVPGIHQEREAS